MLRTPPRLISLGIVSQRATSYETTDEMRLNKNITLIQFWNRGIKVKILINDCLGMLSNPV
jgi:hypothetical protein